MPQTLLNRRHFALGMAAGGLVIAQKVSASPVQISGSRNSTQIGYHHCRTGQVHFRSIRPTADSGKIPFLCLHASPGSSRAYTKFLPNMGSDRLAIAADTPGYGLSDRPPEQSSIADFAGAMGDLMDAMNLEKIDLLGNHTSSATALELARQRPDLVRKIVLNSALLFTPTELAEIRADVARSKVSNLESAADQVPERWKRFREYRSDLSDEQAWLFFWETNRDPIHQDWGYAAAFDYDFEDTLAQTTHPMLILNPDDVLFPMTARAQNLIQNGNVVNLPWKMGTFGTHSAEVATLIRDFLED